MKEQSLVGWLLHGFSPHLRGVLLLNVALNRPTPVRDNFTCIKDFREEFAAYWEDVFGFPAPLDDLGYCLTLSLSSQTLNYFRTTVEAIDRDDVEHALRDLVSHLNGRVVALRQCAMN